MTMILISEILKNLMSLLQQFNPMRLKNKSQNHHNLSAQSQQKRKAMKKVTLETSKTLIKLKTQRLRSRTQMRVKISEILMISIIINLYQNLHSQPQSLSDQKTPIRSMDLMTFTQTNNRLRMS